jgi:hypothetical protein
MPDLWQVVAKIDTSGTRYVWGLGLLYEELSNGSIRVFHYDMRGNTVAFSNSQGAVVGQVSYGPFGEMGDREGQTDSLFLFGGMFGVITHPSGLNYMRFRTDHLCPGPIAPRLPSLPTRLQKLNGWQANCSLPLPAD